MITPSLVDFFIDPVLRAPTLGSMLMCVASSLIGALAFVQRRSLLGEALSHAAYPGVVVGVFCAATLFPTSDGMLATFILIGAFVSSWIGLLAIYQLQKRFRVTSDAALCFVLSIFFGTGILLASRLQFTHALWYKQIQVFLYGQAATMTDFHVGIYALLGLMIALVLTLFYRSIQAVSFDKNFTESTGVKVHFIEFGIFFLLVLSIVVGMRSVGVVLMSGMLIAPAVAARQWTHTLSYLFVLAGCVGLVSGFLGNYLSVNLPIWFDKGKVALPTGPIILLTASFLCMCSLLFAPESGLVSRYFRVLSFRSRRHQENILKVFWKKGEASSLSFKEIVSWEAISPLVVRYFLYRLTSQRWIAKGVGKHYHLTTDGQKRAAHVVRLHRLWEVYLVDYVGQQAGKVHRSAEEMEHILSPELEKELSLLLQDPKQDPHNQPIPPSKDVL
jgi:manganese/zinc/iron transport system permease protein